jgi:nicotinamide phosphoribosyltransferase
MYNLLFNADSYKLSHFAQYPKGTEHIYSYIEPRKGSYPVVVLGIQKFCEDLERGVMKWEVEEAEELATLHGVPFNREGWDLLLQEYPSGVLPLKVMGVPEGTVVTPGTPVAILVNTDPRFPWLTSYFETKFLRDVWYPSTVASRSRYIKNRIAGFMQYTGADMSTLEFKLHDFGARGVSSEDSAIVGGTAHLTQFKGSDTFEAVAHIHNEYGVIAGFSIPATEHSTVTSWGRENEKAMYENFLRVYGGEGKIFACVSDSYNIWEALKIWKELEPVLLEVGGTLVIRPDSGDPVTTPVQVIEELMDLFGFTVNAKGYKVLPSHIRVIQGDGVDEESIVRIMQRMVDRKLSIDNIAFGMGGGLLQSLTRDTLGWAMKCSAACINGKWTDVYKDPIGGGKTSKRGLVFSQGCIPYDHLKVPQLIKDSVTAPEGWVVHFHNGHNFTFNKSPSGWAEILSNSMYTKEAISFND